jgi:hypothetical protein
MREESLPETASLPSAKSFAERIPSGTRRIGYLPSAALGKGKHSAKSLFAEYKTLGKK